MNEVGIVLDLVDGAGEERDGAAGAAEEERICVLVVWGLHLFQMDVSILGLHDGGEAEAINLVQEEQLDCIHNLGC